MKIGVIGTGYVGAVSGACFAKFGHTVICGDTNAEKIEALKAGKIPIYEPGLDIIVMENVKAGRLKFTTDTKEVVTGADAVFIAVGTPTSRRGDGFADLKYVKQAAKDIAKHLTQYTVIVNKSTVPVGTADLVKKIIKETNPKAKFDVASNPEFLREGAAIRDFEFPDKIVLGTSSARATEILKSIYQALSRSEMPFVITNPVTAELIKYANNSFLAVKISFINEMANLCEVVGADVITLGRAIGMDGRIAKSFLHPGPGWGGSCFPKDVDALIAIAKEKGVQLRIVEAAKETNRDQRIRMINKIRKVCGGSVRGKTIGVLGLAFKQDTDDMREAAALIIIPALIEDGAEVIAFDPQAMEVSKTLIPDASYVENEYEACKGVDAVVVLTEWNQFGGLNLKKMKRLMRGNGLADLRNIYDPEVAKKIGFNYTGVGRG
ncbi:MAG: UDP-glucose/GDP-mannose dehydrogenase family protein [Parcubacteria group bacterium]|jgi:UDPglucose 6-dehydrogenase